MSATAATAGGKWYNFSGSRVDKHDFADSERDEAEGLKGRSIVIPRPQTCTTLYLDARIRVYSP